jgi:pectate lyase
MNLVRKMLMLNLLPFLIASCATQKETPRASKTSNVPIAFPGAEGFGKYTTGGRGGKVMRVTNLEDNGPGSLREAVTAKDKRIILFTLSGTIHLETKLVIGGNCTIAGQSAPGDGICLADQPVSLGGDNIILRYMRFRMGDKYQKGGMIDGNGGDDALGASKRKNIIIDHCSVSWSTDEVFSVYGGDSTTLQWNLIAEPLNYSYHFETGDTDWEHHGYGGIWGGSHLTAHHNLFAHCLSRNPRFNGTRLGATQELADFRNNLIYNWGHNNIYGGEAGNYNIVNNYFKYGPGTSRGVRTRIANPWKSDKLPIGKWYVNGNYVDEAKDVTYNNWMGIHMSDGATEADKKQAVVNQPHSAEPLPLQSATEAYNEILQKVGASYRRDTMDLRLINDVIHRTGKYIDVQGGFPHGTAYELTINAWPALKSVPSAVDTDQDGMPDEWEKRNKLNPADAKDAGVYGLSKSYTNIEVYINSLVK